MASNINGSSQPSQSQNQTFTFHGSSKKPKPISRRGVLIDGKWHCDCDPPALAKHLQTKNGGRNHGRWFNTCRKPQGKRCGFFLWDDDARRRAGDGGANTTTTTTTPTTKNDNNGNGVRNGDDLTASDLEIMAMDESVLGGNQKGYGNGIESHAEPQTPTSNRVRDAPFQLGLLTPVSGMNRGSDAGNGSKRKRDWNEVVDTQGVGDETPSKRGKMMTPTAAAARTVSAIKNNLLNGGRSNNNNNDNALYPQTPPRHPENKAASPFATRLASSQLPSSPYSSSQSQSQPHQSQFRGTPVPTDNTPSTPTPSRFLPAGAGAGKSTSESTDSDLTSQTLSLLASHKTPLQPNARKDLAKLLDTHDLRLRGVSKGRDISRVAVRKKDEQIETLLGRIDVLEAERETWRASALRNVEEKDKEEEE